MQPGTTSLGTIGFVGLGDMGAGIASNCAKHLDLVAFDLRPEMESAVLGWGGRWAESVEALLSTSDVVCLCLVDDDQLRAFVDDSRAFETMRRGTTLVLHSTLSPQLVRAIAAEGAERGIEVVDAPVSGARPAAEAGTLSVMVGATEATFERLQPLWDAIGTVSFRMGDVPGSGQVAKLCNNLISQTNMLVALEAIKLARACGMDEDAMVEVARAGSGNSWVFERWGLGDDLLMNHPQGGQDVGFHMLLKDVQTAVRMGAEIGVDLKIAGLAAQEGLNLYADRHDELTARAAAETA